MRLLFFILFLFSGAIAYSQAMDNTALYNSINSNNYLRFSYDNDFFSGEDRYYTQGINLELASPAFTRSITHKILFNPAGWNKIYSIAAEHNGYTPTSIQSDSILAGNRPFAAALFAKASVIATDPIKKQRLSSTWSLGIIGPGAGGAEMQTSIHAWTDNIIPQGWQHQIQNDLVLNYQVNYDRNIISIDKYVSVDAYTMGRIGTLSTKASAGVMLTTGYFDDYYEEGNKKFNIRLYTLPVVNAIGYDATLQGGLFNNTSPYTIAADKISRFTFENRFGIVLNYKNVVLAYFQSYRTPEFSGSSPLRFGGIQAAFKL